MKISLLPEAECDLERGADFYESQVPGLGAYFTDSLISDIDSLSRFAGIHERYLGYYRSLAKRFPFVIYYMIEDETIRIYAVLDARQNPGKIDVRLSRSDSD